MDYKHVTKTHLNNIASVIKYWEDQGLDVNDINGAIEDVSIE